MFSIRSSAFVLLLSLLVGFFYQQQIPPTNVQDIIHQLKNIACTYIDSPSLDCTSTTIPDYSHSTTPTTAFLGLPNPTVHTMSPLRARTILKTFAAPLKSEGAGARVRRSVGVPQLRNFSPFLMLDHFTIPPSAGFPDHPHRGQETITYLLSGSVDHEDFAGGKGTIRAGDLQFMTAGRGIVHAEMPGRQGDDGTAVQENVGMQLWVDLPKELKYCEPRYRDLRREEIPAAASADGKVNVKVISGNSMGVESVKDLAYTPVWLFDGTIQPGGRWEQPLPADFNAFVYTLAGAVTVHPGGEGAAAKSVDAFHNIVLARDGEGVVLSVPDDAKEPARVFVVAGKVLDQEIVQYGPFVVNSEEEVYRALQDYQLKANGFERARGWRSEIGKAMG